jgi:ABC-2 type transport system ATP-binding protein
MSTEPSVLEAMDPPEAPPVAPLVSGNVIEIEGMVKKYGKTKAVNQLSLHVPRGSVYGFVGPNGAGKTTTIRTLATLQRPDSGTVTVCGADAVRNPRQVRDSIGYMPDFFGVYERLTVAEYLDFYGSSNNLPAARRRQLADELLELVDLTDKRSDQVEVLSRGMKQRLGLARCLMHDPEVLLLDEPASGMDPRARIELREILRQLSRMNKTILISSHILPELAEMCTHIGIIRGGQILAEGPVDAVVTALSRGPRLQIRVTDPAGMPRAKDIVSGNDFCQLLEDDDERTIAIDFTGTEADMAALLRNLHEAGVPVSRFGLESGTLEDVFLNVTDLSEDSQ